MMNNCLYNRIERPKIYKDSPDLFENKSQRPTCPCCNRELIEAFITAGDVTFATWMCDCIPQPNGVAADIVRAREWSDETLFYMIEYHQDAE